MPSKTKVILSPKELELVKDKEWILTKRSIIERSYDLFAEAVADIGLFNEEVLQGNIRTAPPKISKGENYRGFPYVMMDYPRCFEKENIFAVRTMFWWANFFSITIHLAGTYKDHFAGKLLKNVTLLEDLFICVNDDPWQHYFEPDNYVHGSQLGRDQIQQMITGPFIKFALKYELEQWNEMQELLKEGYRKMGLVLR